MKKKLLVVLLAMAMVFTVGIALTGCGPSVPGIVGNPPTTAQEMQAQLRSDGWSMVELWEGNSGVEVSAMRTCDVFAGVMLGNMPEDLNVNVWVEAIEAFYAIDASAADAFYEDWSEDIAEIRGEVPAGVSFTYEIARTGNVVVVWFRTEGSLSLTLETM